ncbi:MAG: hypothetical protein Q4B87_00895 [Candidatus Saccharibacteria bacterium]|nr:hypothetical protein [Candidatus Saccharibacteria bacterium]
MRTENSIKNVFWTTAAFGINLIVNFIARKFFIEILGAEYNGLNSLLTSIISILSIAELGIGTTIIYYLYKPLHEKNKELIKSLMEFYKKSYRLIASIVLLLGLAIMPFLTSIIGEINIDINIYIVYILFLLESVVSYLFSYKRSIIIADQKERIIKYTHIGIILLMNVMQIATLYLTKNYYVFLLIKILFTCLENIILANIANRKYSFIKEKANSLPTGVRRGLTKKIRAMFYHQIGGFVVNGTDNIMISIMFGVTEVGMYNNYFLIVTSIFGLIDGVFSGVTASIGNLLVAKNKKDSLSVYRGILGISYVLAIYITSTFCVCVQPLVRIWLGDAYIMSELVVVVLAVYLYFKIMKLPTVAFKNAAGIFYEDRFVPIIESVVNIVASLICAKIFGVSGIIMGTIISTFVLYFGSYPFIVYKQVFAVSPVYYFRQHLTYSVLAIASSSFIILLSNIVILKNDILEIIKNLLISTGVSVIVLTMLWCMNSDFSGITKNLSRRIMRRGKKDA